jgi:hypothetical protein
LSTASGSNLASFFQQRHAWVHRSWIDCRSLESEAWHSPSFERPAGIPRCRCRVLFFWPPGWGLPHTTAPCNDQENVEGWTWQIHKDLLFLSFFLSCWPISYADALHTHAAKKAHRNRGPTARDGKPGRGGPSPVDSCPQNHGAWVASAVMFGAQAWCLITRIVCW